MGKVKTAEEYSANMDRLVSGLQNRASSEKSSKRKMVALWAFGFLTIAALVLLLLQVVDGGSHYAGKGIFW